MPIAPVKAAPQARSDSGDGRLVTPPGYNPFMKGSRLAIVVLVVASFALIPWTLWLTYTLPSRHLTRHYDVAWVGFDIALAVAMALTAYTAIRRSRAVVVFASITGTMLLCDAWFDVITSWDDESIVLAVFAEVPLAVLCLLLARRQVLEEP